mmetsp:Transcript_3477/g.14358  ORF Transcript_3477/g.14358 Transcript_3477/m.14358 type:complete len:224 (+) Transcript_3477:1472-2143(+)
MCRRPASSGHALAAARDAAASSAAAEGITGELLRSFGATPGPAARGVSCEARRGELAGLLASRSVGSSHDAQAQLVALQAAMAKAGSATGRPESAAPSACTAACLEKCPIPTSESSAASCSAMALLLPPLGDRSPSGLGPQLPPPFLVRPSPAACASDPDGEADESVDDESWPSADARTRSHASAADVMSAPRPASLPWELAAASASPLLACSRASPRADCNT